MQRTWVSTWVLIWVTALVGGCGSGGGDGGNTDGGVPSGSGALTWNEGSTAHSAVAPAASRVSSATLDMVQIAGGDAGGAAIAFGVSTAPPLLPGSYACSESGTGGRIVTISYTDGSGSSSGVPSCTIDIAAIGDSSGTRVTGTFSATVSVGGTTKSITDGSFDVQLIVTSL